MDMEKHPMTSAVRKHATRKSSTPTWPADHVERWEISRLAPYVQNPRLHPPGNVAEIAASIERYGFTMPVLVDETGEIIAGAGRVAAAHQLGLRAVPVIVAKDWSDGQKRSYRILDNSIALGSLWSPDMLKLELHDLKMLDCDLTPFNVEPLALLPADDDLDTTSINKTPRTKSTIFVTVPKERAQEARTLIANTLKAAGIDHNL
jgi:hypothetical protein